MNFSIPKVIWMACAGLIFTTLAFTWPYTFRVGSPYQQVRLEFRKNLDSLLQNRLVRLDTLKKKLNDRINKGGIHDTIKAGLQAKLSNVYILQSATQREAMRNDTLNTDSMTRYHLGYFSVNTDSFYSALKERYESDIQLSVAIRDTVQLEDSVINKTGKTLIKGRYKQEPSSFSFYSRQPSFALWLLLTLIQGVAWFMVIIFIVTAKIPTDNPVATTGKAGPKDSWPGNLKLFAIAAAVTGIFCYIVYWIITDTYSLPDHLFMKCFNWRVFVYAIPGYLAAVLCFTAYMRILQPLQTAAETNITNCQASSAEFEAMQRRLQMFLMITVVILCFFVLWLSSLFNSINSLHALKSYTTVSGSTFLPYDFVYLMGLAHSLLLAVFYIPVQFKLHSLKEASTTVAVAAGNQPNAPLPWWKKILPILLEIMVPVTPLLTALLKGLLDAFK
jgi:hypothetical protein